MNTKSDKKTVTITNSKSANSLLSELLKTAPISSPKLSHTSQDHTIALPQNDKSHDELMTELGDLRKEIQNNEALAIQITNVVLVLTSALISFAFSDSMKDNQFKFTLFYLVEIVALIGLSQNTDKARGTYIAGSYIKTFIEPLAPNIKWETRLSKFHAIPVKYRGLNFTTRQGYIYTLIILANFSLGSYYFSRSFVTELGFSLVAIILLFMATLTVAVYTSQWLQYRALDQKHTDVYDSVWQQVKNDEQNP